MADEEGINLMALSMQQLSQLKQSIEEAPHRPSIGALLPTRLLPSSQLLPPSQELQGLQGALQQLQVSKSKLSISKQSLDRLHATPAGDSSSNPCAPRLHASHRVLNSQERRCLSR